MLDEVTFMNNVLFKGILPALVTPLNDDATVRANEVAPMVKWMLSQGVDGFYVLGGTGEGAVLSEKERFLMAEATADALKGAEKKMILHVGAADVQSSLRLARHAAEVGADAISSVYPNFFCRYDMEEAAAYYQALVEASGLPMLCYCTPMIQGADVVTLVDRLMKIDGVIGIKYTFPNYYHLQCIKQLNNGNINVINGPDETLLCGLCMGADGGIGSTYNLMPDWFVKLYKCYAANDLSGAKAVQEKINGVIDVAIRHGVIPAVKLGLEAMGFNVGHAAMPAHRYTEKERMQIIAEYAAAGLNVEKR